ncbi:type IV pilin [Haloarcula pelagica]|uniref:type IV pilin n=1 Tax=Haloarcula pelagica TaxID=3033389 RepID=UPI0024C3C3F7|nr:type IV pilin [Halomicroarcula sp. YJ-61-S]
MNRGGTGRASSAVLGSLLLVTVVVVFAAGLSVFVFDIGETVGGSEPAASVTITAAADASAGADCHPTMETTLLRIHHEAGTAIPTDELRVVGATPTGGTLPLADRCTSLGSRLGAGESFTVAALDGDSVRLQWRRAETNVTLAAWP